MIDTILKEPLLKQIDIIKKCKKHPEFRKELQDLQKYYDSDLNMSIYRNLTDTKQAKCFQIMKKDKLYVNFYGFRMCSLSEEELNKVYLLWVMLMDDELRNNNHKYSIIYYHSMCNSAVPYVFIRDCFKKLPIQYYAWLQKIYVVEGGFLVRNSGVFQFGRLAKLYSRRVLFVENLKELSKIDEIRKNQIVDSLPVELQIEQQSQAFEKTKEEQKVIQLPSVSVVKKQIKKDCLCIRLSQHKFDQNDIPIHLVTLINTMRKNPEVFKMQGIFRKSGSIQQQQQIIQQLSKLDTVSTLSVPQSGPYCAYAIAGVIKKIFTKLDPPIIPYHTYNKIMSWQAIKQQEQITTIRDIILSLPQRNRKIILYVIDFIRKEVLIHEENKMNFYSMSVVLSPCFFRPEHSSLQDLLNSGRFASIVNILFKNFQEIAPQQENKYLVSTGQKEKRGSRSSNGQGSLQPINTNTL